MGSRGMKEIDGGVEFNYDILRIFVHIMMYPQYNNMIIF
jgi:hypothetical protein